MAQTRTITASKLRKLAALDFVLRPLLSLAPRPRDSSGASWPPEHILVVEIWGVGDVVLATPVLAELRERFPRGRISLLAKPASRELLADSGLVDEIIAFDFPWTAHQRKYALARYDLRDLVALFGQLRSRRFDVSLDARRDIRNNVVTYLTGAPRRIGYDFGGASHLLTDALPSGSQQGHKIDDWMRLLHPILGETPPARPPVLRVTDDERKVAQRLLRELGISGERPVVAVHPGASHPIRRLRPAFVRDLAARLRAECDADVLLFIDPDGYGADFGLPAAVRPVRTSLRGLMALIASVDTLVATDSAAMHIATALGTPVTAVFGPQRPDWFGPRDAAHRVVMVEDMPCRPCFDACIYASPLCMDKLTPDAVADAVSAQLTSV